MNAGEMEVLIALVRSVEPRSMIEIGVNEGRTAAMVLSHVPSIETYVGIDVPPDYRPAMAVQAREVPQRPGHLALRDQRFELRLRRHGTLDMRLGDLPPADVVFIDGDHSRKAVEHDSVLARAAVFGRRGMIVWHDYHGQGTVEVRAALHDLAADGYWKIQHVEGTWLAFMRVGE